ncbi:MAG TPA: ATP-binding cassette domain-containing protein [Spirochaetota bacterium]|jgi:ABC-2 type transport system ATP-binding protein|nr:ATP-binding cassette domain-containing protein [Spirochaetota bacterium]HQL43746.1 ATP-binding cassette domain-containing protein [Spirochaetota bacterium]HQQ49986.1 ATP-binding cassette domain-containing protein [Spirochaetota bacterium]
MINVQNLVKHYGEVKAVDGISFTIRKGEVTGLLGPNGAGKTTTLRILTCYLQPTSGMVSIDDYLVDENPIDIKKRIGYLPESAPLYPDMMVYDFLQFIADIREINDAERITDVAIQCGITEVMHKNINELSKGYKQRVGLAQAILHDPEILILDEPTNGLDPNQIIEIRDLIKELGREKTVILSTHILQEVEATCNRVIIIDNGAIVADDLTSELKSAKGKDIRINILAGGASFDQLKTSLCAIPGINNVNHIHDEGNLCHIQVITGSDIDARPAIFNCIKDNGWVLYEMNREYRSLEHVFRELTVGA